MKIKIITICVVLVLIYSTIYFPKSNLEDGAFFGGDTWVYQSQAVNFIKGHNLTFGGIESYDTYKFSPGYGSPHNAGLEGFQYFMEVGKQGGIQDFFGTPGYPFFVGLVYKIFGVHPAIAKQIQLFLLIVTASFLPLIGFYYWRARGLVSGIIAGHIFLSHYALTLPKDILTESFIVFVIFSIIILSIIWERNKNPRNTFLLGLSISYGLLVKGSLVFVPILFLAYFFILYRNKIINFSSCVVLLVGILCLVVPWSVFASVKLGKMTILSTQGPLIITMGNNEHTMSGEPYVVTPDEDSFYNKPEIQAKPIYLRVALFYLNNRKMIPGVFINKIYVGFENLPFFKIAVFLLIFEIYLSISLSRRKNILVANLIVLSIFGSLFYLSITFFRQSISNTLFLLITDAINSPRLLVLFVVMLVLSYKVKRDLPVLPVSMTIFIINFLLVTLMTFGFLRYVEVVAFIPILFGVNYMLLFFIRLYKLIYFSIYNRKSLSGLLPILQHSFFVKFK